MGKLLYKSSMMFVIFSFIISCSNQAIKQDIKVNEQNKITSIKDLDKQAVFSFAVMSDNKGDSPSNRVEFKRMVNWIENANDRFVIGLGDHVKKKRENSFLKFVKENNWWKYHFYPNIADGENEYYGKGQGDWGAGGKLLSHCNLTNRENTTIRANGAEYYSVLGYGEYKIHLIQLHYSDNPKDEKVAFNNDTKQYLMSVLSKINKTDKDIIIAAAHSRSGSWIELMSEADKKIIMKKVDLVFSATTHLFKRIILEGYENSGALCLNTGSITNSSGYAPPGYLQIHVLDNPTRLSVQYIDASKEKRGVQFNEFAFIKELNSGKIYNPTYREPEQGEDISREVANLSQNLSAKEIQKMLFTRISKKYSIDGAIFSPRSDLKKGKVKYKNLYNVFPYNNSITIIKLKKTIAEKYLKDNFQLPDKEIVSLIFDSYNASYFIKKYSVIESDITSIEIHTVDILSDLLNSFDN